MGRRPKQAPEESGTQPTSSWHIGGTATPVTIIPAQPGWGIMIPVRDEDGSVIDMVYDDIVAWLCCGVTRPTPIVCYGVIDGDWVARSPSGGVIGSDGHHYPLGGISAVARELNAGNRRSE